MVYDKVNDFNVLKPWASALANNWSCISEAVVLSDMSKCIPSSAISTKFEYGCWKMIPYETGNIKGNLVWASANSNAPSIKLNLFVKGWYAIFIGVLYTSLTPCRIWLKLDGDVAPLLRSTASKVPSHCWAMQEIFFKVAKLDETYLQISRPGTGMINVTASYGFGVDVGCSIAYVKLIPLSEYEITGFIADRQDRSYKKLAATCDGISYLDYRCPHSVEEILAEVELFRDTDFGTLLLHLGYSDQLTYPSKYGASIGRFDTGHVPYDGFRIRTESVRELEKKNINATKVLIDGAHDIGMKVHIGIRPGLWTYHEPYTEFFLSPFYLRHPEWRTVDRDGTPVARMSWAFPEVRRHLLDILGEAIQFGADGVHIVYNRGIPMVLYEKPFCDMFKKQYGDDPLEVSDNDPRITKLRSEIIAQFMREIRSMLELEEKRRGDGRHLETSICVLGNEYDNMLYGIDAGLLVQEGLVDEIYSYKYDFGAVKREWDVKYFHSICSSNRIHVSPMLSLYKEDIREHLNEIISLYEDGANGLSFFDVFFDGFNGDVNKWSIISRLGHIDEIKIRAQYGIDQRVFLPVHRLGDEILDGRFPIYWGG